jgi:hypothetical protein
MPDNVIVGIHSSARQDPNLNSVDNLTAGHTWISVTRNGVTTNYGLWPDDHPRFRGTSENDPNRSDIRVGLEDGQRADASRYYQLTPEQATQLEQRLRENVTWGYTNTCASWATDTVSGITGQRVNGSELGGLTDTPRQTINSIRELERDRPTSLDNPIRPNEITRSSSFGALEPSSTDTRYAAQRDWNAIYEVVGRQGLEGGQRDNVTAAAHREFGQQLAQLDRVGVYNNPDRLVGTQDQGNSLTNNASISISQTRDIPAAQTLAQMSVEQQQQQQRQQPQAQTLETPTVSAPRMA